jgi:hypothetical protein
MNPALMKYVEDACPLTTDILYSLGLYLKEQGWLKIGERRYSVNVGIKWTNLIIKWAVKRALACKIFAKNEGRLTHLASLHIPYWLLAHPFNCQNF